jgi:hypothetical protein
MVRSEEGDRVGVVHTIQLQDPGEPTAVDASVGYGGTPPTGEGRGILSSGRVARPRGAPGPAPKALRPETRRALRECWKAARAAAERLLAAAEADDAMTRLTAADDLDRVLTRLWELREVRDINWQTILNHCQGMMKQFFRDGKVELLRPEQCRALVDLVERHLGPSTKTVDDLTEAVRLIEDAGGDPFGAISGDPDESSAP